MIHFEVPDHKYDLLGVKSTIELIKDSMDGRVRTMPDNVRIDFLKLITKQMHRLGNLSMPAFNLRIPMERAYLNKFGRREGRRMFIEHYESIHEPYDMLKEEVFEIIERLDPQNKGF